MGQRKEQIAFDAHNDEINELGGSLAAFLINPEPKVYFARRYIRRRGTSNFDPVYSIFEVDQSFRGTPAEVGLIIASDSCFDIQVRENDCLISYNPSRIKDGVIRWPDLWNQFILTRSYFGRRN